MVEADVELLHCGSGEGEVYEDTGGGGHVENDLKERGERANKGREYTGKGRQGDRHEG